MIIIKALESVMSAMFKIIWSTVREKRYDLSICDFRRNVFELEKLVSTWQLIFYILMIKLFLLVSLNASFLVIYFLLIL